MLSTNTPSTKDAIYAVALGLLFSLFPPLFCIFNFSFKIENSFYPFRGSLCFTASITALGEEMCSAGVSQRHVWPGSSLKVCFEPVQRRRCCLRPPGRSWGCAFCTCRRSSAETNGDRSVSSRPGMGTAAAPGELIPPRHQCWGESGASGWQESARLLPACICLAVPEAPSDIQLPHFGLQHKQQLIRHRRLREPDVPRCQAQGGCNTLNKAVPVRFPVRATGFELRIAGRG